MSPLKPLKIARCDNVAAMPNEGDPGACEFCGHGRVIRRTEEVAFYQWTGKGYVFCRAAIPMNICNRCGAKNWEPEAEKLIQKAVRREHDKLP